MICRSFLDLDQTLVANGLFCDELLVQGKGIVGFNMSGGKVSNNAEVCPGTIYWASIGFEGFSGDTSL